MQRRDAEMREFIAIARQVGHEGLGTVQLVEAWRRRDWVEVERYAYRVDRLGRQVVGRLGAGLGARPRRSLPEREAAAQLLDAHDAATRQHFVSYFLEYALLGDTARSLASVRHHAEDAAGHLDAEPLVARARRMPRVTGVRRGDERSRFHVAVDVYGAPDFCRRGADGAWSCG